MAPDQPACRCGVYLHLHPGKGCSRPRRARWRHQHFLWRHVAGRLWLAFPDKARWAIVHYYYRLRPTLCWCDLVDSAIKAGPDWRADYTDPCDVPLPTDAGKPRPGWCYCTPAEVMS